MHGQNGDDAVNPRVEVEVEAAGEEHSVKQKKRLLKIDGCGPRYQKGNQNGRDTRVKARGKTTQAKRRKLTPAAKHEERQQDTRGGQQKGGVERKQPLAIGEMKGSACGMLEHARRKGTPGKGQIIQNLVVGGDDFLAGYTAAFHQPKRGDVGEIERTNVDRQSNREGDDK